MTDGWEICDCSLQGRYECETAAKVAAIDELLREIKQTTLAFVDMVSTVQYRTYYRKNYTGRYDYSGTPYHFYS
jgi:hypothetical protein